MFDIILWSVATLGILAAAFAAILYLVAKKFEVQEDPRIDEVNDLLPLANCGGCGYPGCRGFAEALVTGADAGSIEGLFCPPGGSETMSAVGDYLGMAAQERAPELAVLRCGGSCEKAPAKSSYDGPASCKIAHNLFAGESGCNMGCLGLGDCVSVCTFDALSIDPVTKLPMVDEEKCTACKACVDVCPRLLFELRPLGKRNRRVWVNCQNKEKGAVSRKHCSVSCIGCGKCVKVCPPKFSAITMENNLAYIDPAKCVSCGLCVKECPTGAIVATFDIPTPKAAKEKVEDPAK